MYMLCDVGMLCIRYTYRMAHAPIVGTRLAITAYCDAASNPSDRDGLDFQVFVDAIMGTFASETGFFDAAEGGFRAGESSLVHAHHTHL